MRTVYTRPQKEKTACLRTSPRFLSGRKAEKPIDAVADVKQSNADYGHDGSEEDHKGKNAWQKRPHGQPPLMQD